jgi:hypothetical protein
VNAVVCGQNGLRKNIHEQTSSLFRRMGAGVYA